MVTTPTLNATNVRRYMGFYPKLANAFDVANIHVKTDCCHSGGNDDTTWDELYIPFKNFVQIEDVSHLLTQLGEVWDVCPDGSGIDIIDGRPCIAICINI